MRMMCAIACECACVHACVRAYVALTSAHDSVYTIVSSLCGIGACLVAATRVLIYFEQIKFQSRGHCSSVYTSQKQLRARVSTSRRCDSTMKRHTHIDTKQYTFERLQIRVSHSSLR
eukprot:5911741-Pleurochrysis_carterae.AAC.1